MFKPIIFEHHIFPGDSTSKLFISYKIPYNNLVFVKSNSHYTGSVSVSFNVFNDEQIIARETCTDTISITDYELTNSKNHSLEGLIEFELKKGTYTIQPELEIQNTQVSIQLEKFDIKIEEEYRTKILSPFIVYQGKVICNKDSLYRLVNHSNSIPFSPDDYSILLQIRDTAIKEALVKFVQKEKTIFEKNIAPAISKLATPTKCSGNIILKPNGDINSEMIVIDNVSNILEEGPAKLIVKEGDKEYEYFFDVRWIDKPRSLMNPEFAIERLRIIENKKTVDSLLSNDTEVYAEELFKYWKSKDPVNETAFNELMNEFYRRIDDANLRFQTTDNKMGADTDRGEILIKFGEPDSIERNYSDKDNILEIWKYEKINKQFIFADNTGLGNFILVRNE
ncbi:MAG: GWxTD domain-containing protein [bacterium]